MIVKVQMPLASTEGPGLALVYDEERRFQELLPKEWFEEVMGGRPKAYFRAEVVGRKLHLNAEVKPQKW